MGWRGWAQTEPWAPQHLEGARARKTPPGGAAVPAERVELKRPGFSERGLAAAGISQGGKPVWRLWLMWDGGHRQGLLCWEQSQDPWWAGG